MWRTKYIPKQDSTYTLTVKYKKKRETEASLLGPTGYVRLPPPCFSKQGNYTSILRSSLLITELTSFSTSSLDIHPITSSLASG